MLFFISVFDIETTHWSLRQLWSADMTVTGKQLKKDSFCIREEQDTIQLETRGC